MGVGAYGISVAAFGRDARRKVLIASMRPRLLLPGKVQINQHTAEPVVPIVFFAWLMRCASVLDAVFLLNARRAKRRNAAKALQTMVGV